MNLKKLIKNQMRWLSQFKKRLIILFLFFILIGNINLVSFAFDLKISKTAPFQGETIMIALPQNVYIKSAFLGNLEGIIFNYKNSKRIVFGLPATQPPGYYKLRLQLTDDNFLEKRIIVRRRQITRINLGVPKQLGLTPENLTATVIAKKSGLKSIVSSKTEGVFFSSSFGLPLSDNQKISSYFGEIRSTGSQEIRHLGVDFIAPKGKPIAAINDGIVVKTYNDDLYGNSVIINHGAGIYSLYLHLDQIKTSEGKKIKKGEILGTVGASGYATAPHLHLSITVGGVSVDPIQFISGLQF